MSDNNGSDGTSSGTWSGLVSSLVFSLLVTAVVFSVITCCSIPYREFFFPRKYLVRKRIVAAVAQQPVNAAVTATREPAGPTADQAGTVDSEASAGPGMMRSVRFERVANPRYAPPAPPEFNPLAPVVMPWRGMWARLRLHLVSGDGWASLRGPWSLLQHTSLDAHMLDVLHQLALAWSICNLVLAIPVALVCAIGTPPPDDPLYNLSTARLPQGSGRLWVVFGALAASVVILLVCLHIGYREYERQRIRWLSVLTPASYSLLLTGVPAAAANSMQAPATAASAAFLPQLGPQRPAASSGNELLSRGQDSASLAALAVDQPVPRSAPVTLVPGAVEAAAKGYEPPLLGAAVDSDSAAGVPDSASPVCVLASGVPTQAAAPVDAKSSTSEPVAVRLHIAAPAQPPRRPALTLFASLQRPLPSESLRDDRDDRDGHGAAMQRRPTAATQAVTAQAPLRSPLAGASGINADPASDSSQTGRLNPGSPAPPVAAAAFGAVEMVIAQARRSRRLHRYASAFAETAVEWETAIARRAAAADPAHESYGRLKVLSSHRSKHKLPKTLASASDPGHHRDRHGNRRYRGDGHGDDDDGNERDGATARLEPAAEDASEKTATARAASCTGTGQLEHEHEAGIRVGASGHGDTAAPGVVQGARSDHTTSRRHKHDGSTAAGEDAEEEPEDEADAKKEFTVSEAVRRLEARMRSRYVKLQLLRRLYNADALENAAASIRAARRAGAAVDERNGRLGAALAETTETGSVRLGDQASGTVSGRQVGSAAAATAPSTSTSPSDTASSGAMEEGLAVYDTRLQLAANHDGRVAASSSRSPVASPEASPSPGSVSAPTPLVSASPAATPKLEAAAPPLSASSAPAATGAGSSVDAASASDSAPVGSSALVAPAGTVAPTGSRGGSSVSVPMKGTGKADSESAAVMAAPGLPLQHSSLSRIAGMASAREQQRMDHLLQSAQGMSIETAAREGLVKPAFKLRVGVSDTAFVTLLRAADAAHLQRRGKAGFLLGFTDERSSAVLEALGLPPAGLGPGQAGALASLSVQAAPEPAEVIWRNTYLMPRDRWWRPGVAAVLLAAVMFVAALPTVATAALANLQPLGAVVGFLEPVLSWAGISRGVLQTLVPALIIQIIIALLGTILTGKSKSSAVPLK